MSKSIKKLTLLIGDIILLHVALLLTLIFRFPGENLPLIYAMHWPYFIIVFLVWILSFYIFDLYNLNLKFRDTRFIRQIINTIFISVTVSVVYFYLTVQPVITPKTNLFIFSGINALMVMGWRLFFQAYITRVIPPTNLAVIGNNQRTAGLIEELKKNPGVAYQPVLVFDDPRHLVDLDVRIRENKVRVIVICDDFGESKRMENALFSCLPLKVNFYNFPDFYEHISGKIPVEAIGQDWFLENLKEGQKNNYYVMKRIFDLVFAVIILLATLPFWILIAAAIKLTSPGPVFFRQVRLGLNEKSYVLIKFRTMQTTGNDGSPTGKNDRRITSVGKFLRTTRLDEIPQVLNVLNGEMSFIGPRPERPELVVELEKHIPFYKTRLLVKPGLTGWDQISGNYHSPSVADTIEKLQHDLYYLKHRSIALDLSIMLKTISTVIFHEGR